MKRPNLLLVVGIVAGLTSGWAQTGGFVSVVQKQIFQTVEVPGELQAFETVSVHAKVRGYVERMLVDRGSSVRRGQLLAVVTAPEMNAQIAEAESKVQAADSERAEAEAQLAAVQSTYDRIKKASETPGAIAGNELVQAQKRVEAAEALVQSKRQAVIAARSVTQSQEDLRAYLRITAPFDGVVTARLVHPGALVGPGEDPVMLTIEQVGHLRLVVAVPEEHVASVRKGATVEFRVPANPQRSFSGSVARISQALDQKTRSMAVEVDVMNRDNALSPGMYATVKWPVKQLRPSLLVPRTSVVTTTERVFVVRDRNGRAEWVNVTKGVADGDLIEVSGDLHPGDKVVRRANDEMRDGTSLRP